MALSSAKHSRKLTDAYVEEKKKEEMLKVEAAIELARKNRKYECFLFNNTLTPETIALLKKEGYKVNEKSGGMNETDIVISW